MNRKLTNSISKPLYRLAFMTYKKAEHDHNNSTNCAKTGSILSDLHRLPTKHFHIIERISFQRSEIQIQKTAELFSSITKRLGKIKQLIKIYNLQPDLYKDYYQRTSLGLRLLNMYLLTPPTENESLEKLILYTTCPSLIMRQNDTTTQELLLKKDVADEFSAILYEIRIICILAEQTSNTVV